MPGRTTARRDHPRQSVRLLLPYDVKLLLRSLEMAI